MHCNNVSSLKREQASLHSNSVSTKRDFLIAGIKSFAGDPKPI